MRSLATDSLVKKWEIILKEIDTVQYTNPECDIGALLTIRFTYWIPVRLSPSVYNDPAGYYAVWERCCRNKDIVNIESPDSVAQVFYMEFPPIVKNGQPFINSSPSLFPPLQDFACVGKPFYADFSGTDIDGDSLVYSLAEPWVSDNATVLNTRPDTAFPRPYDPVDWKPGYDLNNMIPAPQALQVSANGLITVTPSQEGLYVFGVKCEKFRNGIKIGEVRRDFQMLVISCIDYQFPEITNLGFSPDSAYNQTDTIFYTYGQGDSPCLNFFVKDIDPNTSITTEIIPLNFTLGEDVSLSPEGGDISGANDSLAFQLCLPECPLNTLQDVYAFEVLVKDNSCALPLMDTARFFVKVLAPPNTLPQLAIPFPFVADSNYYFAEIELGSSLNFDLALKDAEGDSISLAMLNLAGQNALFSAIGAFNFSNQSGLDSLGSSFSWLPNNCDALPSQQTEWFFPLQIAVSDYQLCQDFNLTDTVTLMIRLYRELPAINSLLNVSPLQFDVANNQFFAPIKTNEDLALLVTGKANDANIQLSAIANGFNFADFGMAGGSATGADSIGSTFTWSPSCEYLEGDIARNFSVSFLIEAEDECTGIIQKDTLKVELRLTYEAEPNQIPTVSTSLSNADTTYCDTLYLGEQINFDVFAQDLDNHFIKLTALPNGFDLADYGIVFNSLEGVGSISQNFQVSADCDASIYPDPTDSQTELLIDFVVQDSSDCFIKTADTISVKILLIKELSPNQTPLLTTDIADYNASTMTYTINVKAGEQVDFNLLGEDPDLTDILSLTAAGNGFNLADLQMDFSTQSGLSPISGSFTWQADCQYLGVNGQDTSYTLTFSIQDGTKDCNSVNQDEITVIINLSDVAQLDFEPINAFSPNGDKVNDEFYLDNLPLDDCQDRFQSISIYNRWGKQVFQSTDRNFRWDGANATAGLYFYEIQFVNTEFKGTVHVFK